MKDKELSIEGKIPPHDIEVEKSVIAQLLMDANSLNIAIPILTPDSFYSPEHMYLYEALEQLHSEGNKTDATTLFHFLKTTGKSDYVGGKYFITQLLKDTTPSYRSLEKHCRILQQLKIQRRLIQVTAKFGALAFDMSSDPFELIAELNTELFNAQNEINTSRPDLVIKGYNQHLRDLDSGKNNTKLFYIEGIDEITQGSEEGSLIVVAARPSMGKTALMVSMAINMAKRGQKIGVLSLEMPKESLINRIITQETFITYEQLKTRSLSESDWNQLYHVDANILNNIIIDDEANVDLSTLQAKMRYMKTTWPEIAFIAIDYLGLIKPPKTFSRDREIGMITTQLKALAKDLRISIILLSQLSRKCEERTNKMPMLSDLRDSGSIEQDADMVIFPFRPEYYEENPEGQTIEINGVHHSFVGLALYDIAKNRNGATGIGVGKFIKEKTKYV